MNYDGNKELRVLLLYDTMDRPETELVVRLIELGVEVKIICNTSRGFYHLVDKREISLTHLECRSRVDVSAIRLIRSELRETQYDLVHAFTSRLLSATLIATIGVKSRPNIVAYRGAIGNVSRVDPTSYLTYLNSRVSGINCVSEAVKVYLSSVGVPQSKLYTIYKGHDVSWYQSKVFSRDSLGISAQSFVVGCVANQRPNKGVDLLLQAADLLASQRDLHFLIIGDMRGLDPRKYVSKEVLPRIHLMGIQENVPSLLRACDISVMPTRYSEGLPKAVIESMSVGTPVVVTRVGGMIELVRDGVDGLVVDPCSAEAIAQGILDLRANPEQRQLFSQSGKVRISTDFNISRTVSQTLEFYHKTSRKIDRSEQ